MTEKMAGSLIASHSRTLPAKVGLAVLAVQSLVNVVESAEHLRAGVGEIDAASWRHAAAGITSTWFGRTVAAIVHVDWPGEPPCSEEEDCVVDPLHSSKVARFCLVQAINQSA